MFLKLCCNCKVSRGVAGKLYNYEPALLNELLCEVENNALQALYGSLGTRPIACLNAITDGNLDKAKQIVKVEGFVASHESFTNHHLVINGCSDLLVEVFGDRGLHSRFAVGCASLPLDACVEVGAIVELFPAEAA